MKKRIPIFLGTCVSLPASFTEFYDEKEREILYETFSRHLGKDEMRFLNSCYSVPLKKDYAVRFGTARVNGKKVLCLHHSMIHHFWEMI